MSSQICAFELEKDVASQYALGWDWMAPISFSSTILTYGGQTSHIDSATGGRLFKVNGQPIIIHGGNWILSDGLLRLSKERYKTDIKFHADLHFNMIRCWGGGLAERTEFYHYCDIYGLLVWQEFWSTEEIEMVTLDTVKLLRNHPSLAHWVGENEQVPRDEINEDLENVLRLNPYFENSNEISKSSEDLSTVSKDPGQYFDGTRVYIQGPLWDRFANVEVDSVRMAVAYTIRARMSQEGWQIPLFKQLPSGVDQIELYGTPKDLDDFCLESSAGGPDFP
ncbi:hypothetical protein CMV_004050 [Castanea mollissima]|uniref:Uncharacterized protein n=1 Tax=Castanea mollissima TaxID=60419 RepID=A0A8J4RUV3_9ROSI|nr:hypothetical protein CMV_004050 [Castanea mollissima]